MPSNGRSKTSRTRKKGKSKSEEIVVSKRSSPIKRRSKFRESSGSSKTACTRTTPKISKAGKISEPIPSTSYAPDLYSTPKSKCSFQRTSSTSNLSNPYSTLSACTRQGKYSKANSMISPKVMNYALNAYKSSPDYHDLKKKRFNTSFLHETPRGDRDIQIFTPEEDNSPVWTENLPVIKNKIRGIPGEKYAATFKSIPGFSTVDEVTPVKIEKGKKNVRQKGKKGRKKSIGYKGVPLADENLLVDYTGLFDSD